MTKVYLLAVFIGILPSVYGQIDYFEIKEYTKSDSSSTILMSEVCRQLFTNPDAIHSFSFSKTISSLNDTISLNLPIHFLGKAEINPNVMSLLLIEKMIGDTVDCLVDKQYKLRLLNLNQDSVLVSSACIARYGEMNNGFSFSGLDSNLSFKNNVIYLQEIHEHYPVDLILKLEINDETFKTHKYFKFKLDNAGILTRIK